MELPTLQEGTESLAPLVALLSEGFPVKQGQENKPTKKEAMGQVLEALGYGRGGLGSSSSVCHLEP